MSNVRYIPSKLCYIRSFLTFQRLMLLESGFLLQKEQGKFLLLLEFLIWSLLRSQNTNFFPEDVKSDDRTSRASLSKSYRIHSVITREKTHLSINGLLH